MKVGDVEVTWFGHASFLLDAGGVKIYIDPWKLPRGSPDADYVLITHDHYDHYSEPDIDAVSKDNLVLVGSKDMLGKLNNFKGEVHGASPGDEIKLEHFTLTVIPAYNTNKNFHPSDNNWVGYILDINGTKIYHAGDTDIIPEMNDLECDLALLPVSGTYVMTAEEAAKACEKMKVKHAVPMHYGAIVGDKSDAENFKKLAKCKVTILDKK